MPLLKKIIFMIVMQFLSYINIMYNSLIETVKYIKSDIL